MDDILVSIGCITYNHEKYIADAIEGFLMQKTNFKLEIIINDDASTDKTADIIRTYEEKYPNIIKAIYQVENQFSKGIDIDNEFIQKNAKGKYIAVCEGDDYWTDPYKLQKQVDYMEGHPQCSMCFHAAKRVTPDKKPLGDFLGDYGSGNNSYELKDIGGEFLATASKMYVKTIMDNPPGWYFIGEASDFTSQLIIMEKGYAYYIDEVMSAYRVNVPGSSNERYNKRSKEELVNYNKERIKILNEFNKYSNYRHLDFIKKTALTYELNILLLEEKIKSRVNKLNIIKSKGYFESMKSREKTKLYTKCYFPKSYEKLAHVKAKIYAKQYDGKMDWE